MLYLECRCSDISKSKWDKLMANAKRFSYRKLVRMIKTELPEIYDDLALNLYNPWSTATKQTSTHYILVHSATEYFFRKED